VAGNMMVLWTLACFRTLRMRVRVRRLHECTERVLLRRWYYRPTMTTNLEKKTGYCYQTVPRTP